MHPRRKYSGFTILEIVIVFILLAAIMAFVGPKIWEQFSRAKSKEGELKLRHVANQVEIYRVENNAYPSNLEALLKNPTGGVPYLKQEDLKDAWGNDYRYTVPGTGKPFDLVSFGADGREGGEGENKDIRYGEK